MYKCEILHNGFYFHPPLHFTFYGIPTMLNRGNNSSFIPENIVIVIALSQSFLLSPNSSLSSPKSNQSLNSMILLPNISQKSLYTSFYLFSPLKFRPLPTIGPSALRINCKSINRTCKAPKNIAPAYYLPKSIYNL